MRKLNKKVLVSIISLFLILNILTASRIFAATITTEDTENKTTTTTTTNANGDSKVTTSSTDGSLVGSEDIDVSWTEPTNFETINKGCYFAGGAFTFDDLVTHGDYLCSERGALLTGSSAPTYDSLGESSSGSTHNRSEVPDLTPVRTQAYYTVSDTMYASPEEAFILAYAKHEDGATYGEYTPAQIAFWNTPAGKGLATENGNFIAVSGVNAFSDDLTQISNQNTEPASGTILDTTLSQTVGNTFDPDKNYNNLNDAAKEFQNYIIAAAGVNTVDEVEREEDGFFKLNYNPSWVEEEIKFEGKTYDCSKPTVAFDEATQEGSNIIVGPFAINYVYNKNFSYITEMTLETDDPEHKELVYGTDWVISNVDESNTEYPGPNAPFYIIIKNKYNATKIKNIHVEFAYANARGDFNYFYGEIKQSTTNLTTTSEWVTRTDSEGNEYQEQIFTYNWSIQVGTLPSQRIAGNIDAEIRMFYTSIDRETENESQIEIEKVLVDENGNEITVETDDAFEFELTVNGAKQDKEASESEILRVKAGETVSSKAYVWDGDTAPTYSIKEINCPEGYEINTIEAQEGSLVDGRKVKVIAKNTIAPKTGSLDLVKKAEENPLGESDLIDADNTFEFEITVSGKFKYNDGEYKEQTVTIPVSVVADGASHTVIADNVIKWYTDEAPTYTVKEVNLPDGVQNVSITPNSGSFAEAGKVTVTSINAQETEKGKIVIIKTLENASNFTEEELEALEFNFKIKVDGHDEEDAVATFFEKTQDTSGAYTYTWKYESQDYEWLKGHNPNYTIKEVNNPEGTQFDLEKTQEANANNPSISVSADGLSGTLIAGDEATGVIENYVVNNITPKRGSINLIKKVDEDILADKDYSFIVTVTGTFDYKGVHFENQTIQLTTSANNANGYNILEDPEVYNDQEFVVINASKTNMDEENGVLGSGSWSSDEFTWYGEAPTYQVQENLNGEDINSSINPSKGTLEDNSTGDKQYLITVTAWNGHDKVGYIHIIKEVENSDKTPVDYIKTLEFKFKIKVDGYEEYTVTLVPELKDDKWVWEYTSNAFSWRFDEEAPNYTIEEVDIPEGVTFVSANGETTNKVEGTLIENKTSDINIVTTDNTFVNRIEEHKGTLTINKEVLSEGLNGKEFKFNVTLNGTFTYGENSYNGEYTIEDVVVSGGSSWTSDEIKWYGNVAPTYSVEEQESENSEIVSMDNNTGTIQEGGTDVNIVTFRNISKKTGGYLEITKQITDGISTDKVFYFEVRIGDNEPFVIGLKANETYKSDYIEWYISEGAPTYSVKEIDIPDGAELVEIINGEGTLSENSSVTVVAENSLVPKTGRFKVTKEVVPNKYIDAAVIQNFEIKISISGTFQIDGKMHYAEDGAYEYTETIGVDVSKSNTASYVSPDITWWGDEAPTVTIEEINLPEGWRQVGSPSNNGASLVENGEIELVITNELPVHVVMDLTIELAGQVWEDVRQDPGKNMLDSVPNGKIDETEEGIKGVEVYVYRVATNGETEISRTLATGYDDSLNSELVFPILTTDDGAWEAPRMEILALTEEEKAQGATSVKFDVEFVYDGQTYEPTIFLSKVENNQYVEGDPSEYINASTSERDAYADRSMAKDFDREVVNNRIQNIYGKTPIDGNGETVGTVSGADNVNDIYYKANVTENEATRVQSELITTNEDGTALDVFKTKARTSVGGLMYPFDNRMHLENYDVVLTGSGLEQRYTYSATYNYCLHINLGLVRREESDIEAIKDLYSAKVVVDGKELDYTFNKLEDLGKDALNRQVNIDSANVTYELGLYSTDYYYRAEIYRANSDLYNAVKTFYKSIGREINDSELEVYLTYKINLYNTSGSYIAQINSVDDYFDSSFGAPIQTAVTKIVDGELKEVANSSYMMVGDSRTDLEWTVTEENILGSDNITYNKMSTNLNGVRLASGERAEIYVTFAVQKDSIDGVKDAIELGNKSNVAEISSYTTYYQDGSIAGKIDKDSAPANVNIRDYNEKTWYEDDTDSAPILTLTLEQDNRAISGVAWEDKSEDENTAIGNGVRDDDEAVIGGLTTELIEKVAVDGIEYDFLWPTNERLDCLGGNTLEELTGGFSSTIETSRIPTDELSVGGYKFVSVPTGDYVVRFLYGNDKTKLEDTSNVSLKPAEALKTDGTSYYDSDLIYTSNYDGDLVATSSEGETLISTPAVYNGQDYKSTIYQAGFVNTDNGYVSNAWHDLENADLANAKVSDARDSEARRLEVIANSQTITNVNGKVLSSANDKDAIHTELYQDYSMFADSAKLDLDIASRDENGLAGVNSETVKGKVFENGSISVEKEAVAYTIKDIDFGIIERPETALVLDKEISSIKLTTNDQNVIFNAKYDINYEAVQKSDVNDDKVIIADLNDDEYLIANVVLNEEESTGIDQLQAINKDEVKLPDREKAGTQNFRFINVDDTILQGTTIEINYQITALNVSEQDYASETLANITETAENSQKTVKQEIKNLANMVKEEQKDGTVINLGKYLGTAYYTGTNNTGDIAVTTKVRQIIDYVDNDAIFTQNYNTENDHMWRNTSITELSGNGIEANRILDQDVLPGYELVDNKGIAYITDQRNNVILSIDSEATEVNSNAGFETELVPYTISNDSTPYKSQIALTVTKTVSAQDDADNLTYDNIAEIVKFENTVGRRDVITLAGNANPKVGEFKTALTERDSSATELVTFTPPTGIEAEGTIWMQALIVTIVGLVIISVGIVIIKKKVLIKTK